MGVDATEDLELERRCPVGRGLRLLEDLGEIDSHLAGHDHEHAAKTRLRDPRAKEPDRVLRVEVDRADRALQDDAFRKKRHATGSGELHPLRTRRRGLRRRPRSRGDEGRREGGRNDRPADSMRRSRHEASLRHARRPRATRGGTAIERLPRNPQERSQDRPISRQCERPPSSFPSPCLPRAAPGRA